MQQMEGLVAGWSTGSAWRACTGAAALSTSALNSTAISPRNRVLFLEKPGMDLLVRHHFLLKIP